MATKYELASERKLLKRALRDGSPTPIPDFLQRQIDIRLPSSMRDATKDLNCLLVKGVSHPQYLHVAHKMNRIDGEEVMTLDMEYSPYPPSGPKTPCNSTGQILALNLNRQMKNVFYTLQDEACVGLLSTLTATEPFTLYLRSFSLGAKELNVAEPAPFALGPETPIEQRDQDRTLRKVLQSISDDATRIFGIGNREEVVEEPTFPLLIVPSQGWQPVVTELIQHAQRILIACDEITPGVAFELEQIRKYQKEPSTLLVRLRGAEQNTAPAAVLSSDSPETIPPTISQISFDPEESGFTELKAIWERLVLAPTLSELKMPSPSLTLIEEMGNDVMKIFDYVYYLIEEGRTVLVNHSTDESKVLRAERSLTSALLFASVIADTGDFAKCVANLASMTLLYGDDVRGQLVSDLWAPACQLAERNSQYDDAAACQVSYCYLLSQTGYANEACDLLKKYGRIIDRVADQSLREDLTTLKEQVILAAEN